MATEQDAARDRVLAARSDLADQLELLGASTRAAIDIPAKIKRSPAKAAAIVGGIGFLALKGPQRLFGFGRRKVRGKPEPMPSRMLPEEIEKTLRKLGDDGEKVRGTLERDFAQYAKKSAKDRQAVRTVLLLSLVRPLAGRAARALGDAIFSTDPEDISARIAQARQRAKDAADRAEGRVDEAHATAQERISTVRRDEPGTDTDTATAAGPADETAPTGI